MAFQLDFKEFKKKVQELPEFKLALNYEEVVVEEADDLADKSEGFKYLYKTVYLTLFENCNYTNPEYIKLNVDLEQFDYDDLDALDCFLPNKTKKNWNPHLEFVDEALSKIPPVSQKAIFI